MLARGHVRCGDLRGQPAGPWSVEVPQGHNSAQDQDETVRTGPEHPVPKIGTTSPYKRGLSGASPVFCSAPGRPPKKGPPEKAVGHEQPKRHPGRVDVICLRVVGCLLYCPEFSRRAQLCSSCSSLHLAQALIVYLFSLLLLFISF